MRCPSCGTQNEPDSRFCGGCGARLAGESRLAPTQKIDTGGQPIQVPPSAPVAAPVLHGTPSAQHAARPSGPHAAPPAAYPLAPSVQRPPNAPVATPAPQAPVARAPWPATSRSLPGGGADSLPLPRARRNGAVIALVLVVDLALAGAGAYLLREGLATEDATDAASAPAPRPAAGTLPPGPRVEPIEPAKVAPIGSGATGAVVPASPAPATANAAAVMPAAMPSARAPEAKPALAADEGKAPAPAADVVKASVPAADVVKASVPPPKTRAKPKAKARRQKTSQPLDPYGPAANDDGVHDLTYDPTPDELPVSAPPPPEPPPPAP